MWHCTQWHHNNSQLRLQYTECRNGAQTRQTVFTILCHQLPVTIGYLRDAVSNWQLRGPVRSSFVDFCMTKFRQNYLWWHLKEQDTVKSLAACHSGARFQPGALRTCVPCLMVNPALARRSSARRRQTMVGLGKTSYSVANCVNILKTGGNTSKVTIYD